MPRPGPSEALVISAIEAYRDGLTVRECAALIGCHYSTLKRHFRKRGVAMSWHGVTTTDAPGKQLFRRCPTTRTREKWCNQCSDYVPTSEFYANAAKASGLASACGYCSRAKDSERRARKADAQT